MLQVRELTSDEPWVARLRYAYADALLAVGRGEESREWFARAAEVDEDAMTDAAERLLELDGVILDDAEDDFDDFEGENDGDDEDDVNEDDDEDEDEEDGLGDDADDLDDMYEEDEAYDGLAADVRGKVDAIDDDDTDDDDDHGDTDDDDDDDDDDDGADEEKEDGHEDETDQAQRGPGQPPARTAP